jgi:type II secretory pathway component PulM
MKAKFNEVTAPLRNLWLARPPKERKALQIGGLLVLLVLYVWLLQAGSVASKTLQDNVLVLRSEAATLQQQADEVEKLRKESPVLAANVTLLAQMETAVARAGLTGLLLKSEAPDADQVILTFAALPFSTWLGWVNALQEQKIQVTNARLESVTTPGLVSVTATFSRPGSQ